MLEALAFEFMRNALLAGLLTGLACGVIGVYVVVNRIVFISGGVAHAAYGGVGLAFFFGFSPLWGITLFSVLVAVIMAFITLKDRGRSDAVIGVLWAVGMALGVILLDLTPGYNVDLMSYLFGSILSVPTSDLWIMGLIDLVIVGATAFFYHDLLAVSYDPEFARVQGVPVGAIYLMLMVMIALSVVLVIQVVGLILTIALLTIPPFIAEKATRTILGMIIVSVILNWVFCASGLWLSFSYDLTSGASIIAAAASVFFLTLLASWFKDSRWGRGFFKRASE